MTELSKVEIAIDILNKYRLARTNEARVPIELERLVKSITKFKIEPLAKLNLLGVLGGEEELIVHLYGRLHKLYKDYEAGKIDHSEYIGQLENGLHSSLCFSDFLDFFNFTKLEIKRNGGASLSAKIALTNFGFGSIRKLDEILAKSKRSVDVSQG